MIDSNGKPGIGGSAKGVETELVVAGVIVVVAVFWIVMVDPGALVLVDTASVEVELALLLTVVLLSVEALDVTLEEVDVLTDEVTLVDEDALLVD